MIRCELECRSWTHATCTRPQHYKRRDADPSGTVPHRCRIRRRCALRLLSILRRPAAMSPGTASKQADKPVKRGLVACTRCRLLRGSSPVPPARRLTLISADAGKCVHQGAPPCVTCISVSKEDGCTFPPRGTSLVDRAVSRTRLSAGPGGAEELTVATQPRGIRKRRKKIEETEGASLLDRKSVV